MRVQSDSTPKAKFQELRTDNSQSFWNVGSVDNALEQDLSPFQRKIQGKPHSR